MERDASNYNEYDQALKDLGKESIIGEHRIGALTIKVNHIRWSVNAPHFTIQGDCGKHVRTRVDAAARKWLSQTKQALR